MSKVKQLPPLFLGDLPDDLAEVFQRAREMPAVPLDVRGVARCERCGLPVAQLLRVGPRAVVIETERWSGAKQYKDLRRRLSGRYNTPFRESLLRVVSGIGSRPVGRPRWHDVDDDLLVRCHAHGILTVSAARIRESLERPFNADIYDDLGAALTIRDSTACAPYLAGNREAVPEPTE